MNTHTGGGKDRATVKQSVLHSLAVMLFYTLLFVIFFAPILFSDYLLAPGDGILYFLPNFYARRVLWDTSVWGGFPAVGDSQLMMWYPPALLFSLVKLWNAFLLSAYVLAASFTYAYCYALTRSRFAATIGGICYGMCGFMIAHLGHAALIHAAAWLPLFLLSLEKLARPTGGGARGEDADAQRSADSNVKRSEDADVTRGEDLADVRREDANIAQREDLAEARREDTAEAEREGSGEVRREGLGKARREDTWRFGGAGGGFWYAVGA
ncbi:MAG TPA: hypothetical protein VGB61_07670, partial [Pyrinomonadaceae bacterium]